MPTKPRAAGFSLLELLVSAAVFVVLLFVVMSMVSQTRSVWSYTRGKVEQFRETREAFDSLTRRLAGATLGTYFDYEDNSGKPRTTAGSTSFVPANYGRQSELRFQSGPGILGDTHAVFFQTPLGRTRKGRTEASSLNTVGYYVELADDSAYLPSFIKARKRFRLMELVEPTEELSVYTYTSGNASDADRISDKWFRTPLAGNPATNQTPPIQIAGENIIALVLLPMLPAGDRGAGNYDENSLAPDFTYNSITRKSDPNLNSRHQLPPLIRVTMIAIDEASAVRLGDAGLAEIQTMLSDKFLAAASYKEDLKKVETWMAGNKVNYRVFTASVNLRNAKWSKEQKG